MKISVEMDIFEMSEAHESMLKISEILNHEPLETLFKDQDIDMNSIKIKQRMGEFEIDIDSNFSIWILKNSVKIINWLKPFSLFIESIASELSKWIRKPSIDTNTNKIPEGLKSKFDV